MADPIRGRTVRFNFNDGPMAGKAFEHTFSNGGSVAFRVEGSAVKPSGPGTRDVAGDTTTPTLSYHTAQIRPDVLAVSYVSKGWTLTTILAFKSHVLVAFSSNATDVNVQHGTFEVVEPKPEGATAHPR
jgi:hypothetical protein